MPRYHFDLPHERDEFGIDLAGIAAARRYAYRYAGELIRDVDAGARGSEYWRMDVREGGQPPAFSLVVELVPATPASAGSPSVVDLSGPGKAARRAGG